MPIVELELVTSNEAEKLMPDVIQQLSDEIGDYLGSDTAGTWLKVRYLDQDHYAENNLAGADGRLKPTFVYVLRYQLPGQDKLAQDARRLAAIVSGCTGRPVENTHIVFEPDGKGRVAFGGELVT